MHRRRYLASSGTDACICLWDTTDMVCVRTFVGMDNDVNNMCFSHNSKYLAYVDIRLGIGIVDVHTGEPACRMPVMRMCVDLPSWRHAAGNLTLHPRYSMKSRHRRHAHGHATAVGCWTSQHVANCSPVHA